jgi:hypothetical protein
MMKPETKRWLAKEWLIYLGLATAIFILVCVDQYDRPYDEFAAIHSIWRKCSACKSHSGKIGSRPAYIDG